MSHHLSETPSSTPFGWPIAFAAATVFGTLATACMMPFVALAVVAAATLPARRAAATVIAVWALNQLIGFTLMGYPPTTYAFARGAALGGASLAAMFVARGVLGGGGLRGVRLVAAFLAAFVVDEALLYGFALGVGGTGVGGTGTFTLGIVTQLLTNDGLWFAGLMALYFALTGLAPRVFGTSPGLRLA